MGLPSSFQLGAKCVSRPRESRFHRTDAAPEDGRDLVDGQAFEVVQRQDGLVLRRERQQSASGVLFGFPLIRCAEIMLGTTIDYLKGKTGLEEVVFCLFGQDAYEVFVTRLNQETAK